VSIPLVLMLQRLVLIQHHVWLINQQIECVHMVIIVSANHVKKNYVVEVILMHIPKNIVESVKIPVQITIESQITNSMLYSNAR